MLSQMCVIRSIVFFFIPHSDDTVFFNPVGSNFFTSEFSPEIYYSMSRYVELTRFFNIPFLSCLIYFYAKDKTPLERAEILATTPLFAKVHTESASSKLNQTAPNLDTDLHFTCFVEAPEADIRWVARDRDVKEVQEVLEKEREEVAHKSGTGMRLVELDGRRDGPIDHGECKDLLKVSRLSLFCP